MELEAGAEPPARAGAAVLATCWHCYVFYAGERRGLARPVGPHRADTDGALLRGCCSCRTTYSANDPCYDHDSSRTTTALPVQCQCRRALCPLQNNSQRHQSTTCTSLSQHNSLHAKPGRPHHHSRDHHHCSFF